MRQSVREGKTAADTESRMQSVLLGQVLLLCSIVVAESAGTEMRAGAESAGTE